MQHPPKNVLFILTDDQRYDAIHALGNPAIHTPNMDRLVEMGTAFTNAHIPGGTSGAICMPSRAMINTGRTLFSLAGEGQDIPPEHTTLAEAFAQAGYTTFGTGKWHNGPPSFARGFNCGDNIFFGGMWDHWNVPVCYFDPTGEYDNVINFTANFQRTNDDIIHINCDKFNPGVHSSELLTTTALDFLRGRREGEPWYVYLSYLAPHDPRTMPKRFLDMYPPEEIQLPENFAPEHAFDFGISEIRDELLVGYPRKEEEVRKEIAEYYAMVTHLDDELGRLLDGLEERGELENTIILLAGDNGLAVGNHGLMGKQNLYDHSVRVPLVVAGPGIPKGQKNDRFVYLLDVFPTLCELTGLPIPASVEGRSFAPMFADSGYSIRDDLYFVYNNMLRGVKDGRYKLIEYRCTATMTQLFDLQNDPQEMHNLYGEPGYEDVYRRLTERLLAYRADWQDEAHYFGKEFWSAYDRTAARS